MKWTPIDAWQAPKGKTHVMFTMAHGYQGDERLLRGEVLAIVAAMITRLERRSLQSRNIIPVSNMALISCVKSNQSISPF